MNPSPSAQNPISHPLKKANPSSHFTPSRPSMQTTPRYWCAISMPFGSYWSSYTILLKNIGGLEVNKHKTEAIWLGPCRNRRNRRNRIYVLGVMISWLIVSITKFSILIGSLRAYLSRNQRAITWVSDLNFFKSDTCNWIPTWFSRQLRAL